MISEVSAMRRSGLGRISELTSMLRGEGRDTGLVRSVRRTVAAVALPLALSGCAFGVLHGKHGNVVGGFVSPTAPVFTSGNPSRPSLVPAP